MRHVLGFILKTLMIAVVLWVILSMANDYPPNTTLGLALLVSGLAYLVGDLGVLPMTNNMTATIADVGLATLTIWLLGPLIVEASIPFGIALLSGIIIGVGEWFFHKFMDRSVFTADTKAN